MAETKHRSNGIKKARKTRFLRLNNMSVAQRAQAVGTLAVLRSELIRTIACCYDVMEKSKA